MVLDRLLVVFEGIHALLIRVPLYRHATEEFSDLLSRYAVDKTSKQTAEAVEQSASTFLLTSLGLALCFWFAA